MKSTFCLTLVAMCGIFLNSASADIVWNPSVNMYQGSTVETFVSTNGTLAVAVNATADTSGDEDVTVNGVDFVGAGVGEVIGAAETITINGGSNNTGSFGDGEFTSNGAIFNLIRGAVFSVNSVTLDNLNIGDTYEVQLFANDARSSRSSLFIMGLGDGSSSGPVGTLELNNSLDNTASTDPLNPEAGDSIIGTFTADATSLTFQTFGTNSGNPANFTQGDGRAQVNGIQLRNITAVPEPGSLALICIGALGLATRRRR